MLNFMDGYGYQNLADTRQEEWFKNTHGKHFFSVLTAHPCFCSYPRTLKEILHPPAPRDPLSEFDERKMKYLAPTGSTINYILGNLHRTTAEQIRKLLKEPLEKGPPILLR
jgi:hypothetical protein